MLQRVMEWTAAAVMRGAATQATAVGLKRVAAVTRKRRPAALAQRQQNCLHEVELLLLL